MASTTPPPAEPLLENYKYRFQPDLLREKVAFVTGGGSGIGFTIVEVLMRHGCNVVIASRNIEKLKAASARLEAAVPGRKCLVTTMDVRKMDEVTAAVHYAMEQFGKIDILVNNSAGNFLCAAENLSSNGFKTVMEIDTQGTFNVSKAVFDVSMKNNGGVILNISATLHINGAALQVHAGCAKAAIEAMTRHLAVEWGQYGIRVAAVSPGPIADTVGYKKLGGSQMSEEQIASGIPLGRVGHREDIANTILFLASDLGSFISGTTIVVDGGSILTATNGRPMLDFFKSMM